MKLILPKRPDSVTTSRLYRLCTVVLFFLFGNTADAQLLQDHYSSPASETIIPFDYINNFIVVKLVLNKTLPLKFILDTGAQHTIITKKEVAEILGLTYKREFRVMGADMKRELIANLVTGIEVEIGDVRRKHFPMLVLDEDYYLFEEMTGTQIHGILGAGFFRRFVIEIDYKKRIIRLKNPINFRSPRKKYQEFNITVESNKPYVKLPTIIQEGAAVMEMKYLIDSGAGISMLLNPKTDDKLALPENIIPGNVGNGLGGSIDGFIGRVSKLKLGDLELRNIVANYHQVENDSLFIPDQRNGLLGNQILDRFRVIIDFPREKLYLRPRKKFGKKFEFDKSGISILSSGTNFNKYIIQSVLEGSPAYSAGIRKGDKVLKINGLPVWLLSLNSILKKLKKKEGKKIRLKVQRNNEKLKFAFTLRKLI